MLVLIKKNFIFKSLVVGLSFGLTLSAMADDATLTALAESGNAQAQYELAKKYSSFTRESSAAFDWYQKAANQDHPEAQTAIGFSYIGGGLVTEDMFKAVEWLTKAAEQGEARAQSRLAYQYLTGVGVRRNIVQAKEWYGKACDNGYQSGCDDYKKLNK